MRGETAIKRVVEKRWSISIHSPHARGDLARLPLSAQQRDFNPLPSCEGRLLSKIKGSQADFISIHSPHARGDSVRGPGRRGTCGFQSTPLMRGETRHKTHAEQVIAISIHSPHARGDNILNSHLSYIGISIHSPHARGDVSQVNLNSDGTVFQSTPLMRGETEHEPEKPPD